MVTRPEPGGSDTAARLRARGFRAVLAPFLRITPLDFTWPPEAPVLQAVLVASGHAVPTILPPCPVPLLAVGDATAQRARQLGWADCRSADGDARDLAAQAVASLNPVGGPVFLASALGQGGGLARTLRDAGFTVIHRETYRADPPPRFPDIAASAIRDDDIRAALFFSAETARHFARLCPADLLAHLPNIEALAIGQPAAAALAPLPWQRIRVAVRPNQRDLLALL